MPSDPMCIIIDEEPSERWLEERLRRLEARVRALRGEHEGMRGAIEGVVQVLEAFAEPAPKRPRRGGAAPVVVKTEA